LPVPSAVHVTATFNDAKAQVREAVLESLSPTLGDLLLSVPLFCHLSSDRRLPFFNALWVHLSESSMGERGVRTFETEPSAALRRLRSILSPFAVSDESDRAFFACFLLPHDHLLLSFSTNIVGQSRSLTVDIRCSYWRTLGFIDSWLEQLVHAAVL